MLSFYLDMAAGDIEYMVRRVLMLKLAGRKSSGRDVKLVSVREEAAGDERT